MSEILGAILGFSCLILFALWALSEEHKRSKAYITKELEQTLLYKRLLEKLDECDVEVE